MQEDMHYYGTYAMARTAGLDRDACRIIATAAQFVDDHADAGSVEFMDGARIDNEATAHHIGDLIRNIDEKDQRLVWVPFHFLPGDEGDSYPERMLCRKDSAIARAVVDHCLSKHDQPYALALLGITAHVYADTFSHHGFSGFSSPFNKVRGDSFEFDTALQPDIRSYILSKFDQFTARFASDVAEGATHALGHGSVATFPDRPYLKWSFCYEHAPNSRIKRNNPVDFLEGCEALHEMFRRFRELEPVYADAAGSREFHEIAPLVSAVLNVQADKQGRIDAWQALARSGGLFAAGAEEIPAYNAGDWNAMFDGFRNSSDAEEAISLPVFHFYQGAAVHRTYVLRELLPRHNLVAH